MINIPEGTTVPTMDLYKAINEFLVDCHEADLKRGGDRVSAFVNLAIKHEMFTTEEAVQFAQHPIDKHLED